MNEILSYLDVIKYPNLLSLLTFLDTTESLIMIWDLRKVPTGRECSDHPNYLHFPSHNSTFSHNSSTVAPD